MEHKYPHSRGRGVIWQCKGSEERILVSCTREIESIARGGRRDDYPELSRGGYKKYRKVPNKRRKNRLLLVANPAEVKIGRGWVNLTKKRGEERKNLVLIYTREEG